VKPAHAFGDEVIRTGEEYIASLRGRHLAVYLFGNGWKSPWTTRSSAVDQRHGGYLRRRARGRGPGHGGVEPDWGTGQPVPPRDREPADLVMQGRMQRRLGQVTGTCFQRCVGMDAHQLALLRHARRGCGAGHRLPRPVLCLALRGAAAQPGARRRHDRRQGRPQ